MAHGERASNKKNHCGVDYWKPRGINGKTKCWKAPVSNRAGTNKSTKQFTNRCVRRQNRIIIELDLSQQQEE